MSAAQSKWGVDVDWISPAFGHVVCVSGEGVQLLAVVFLVATIVGVS